MFVAPHGWMKVEDDWEIDAAGVERHGFYTTQFMAMTGKSWENGKINRRNWGSSISRQIHIPIIPRWF